MFSVDSYFYKKHFVVVSFLYLFITTRQFLIAVIIKCSTKFHFYKFFFIKCYIQLLILLKKAIKCLLFIQIYIKCGSQFSIYFLLQKEFFLLKSFFIEIFINCPLQSIVFYVTSNFYKTSPTASGIDIKNLKMSLVDSGFNKMVFVKTIFF